MNIITIGKRLLPAEQIAFVEPFDPSANPEFKPEKDFKARVVLVNREIVLTEQTVQEFASAHGLHLLVEDGVAVNQAIRYKIEMFEAEQSKLLVTEPETVISEILNAKVAASAPAKRPARRPATGRSGSRRMDAFQS